jgi:hypothetical protein
MPLTMLRKLARCCRLEAELSDEKFETGPTGQLAHILPPDGAAKTKATELLSESEVAKILSVAKDLDSNDYQMLLQYHNSKGELWHDCHNTPHPPGSLIMVIKYSVTEVNQRQQCNPFKDPETNTLLTGFIDEIWQIPLENHFQTLIIVKKHKTLPATIVNKTPYPFFRCFKVQLSRLRNPTTVIQP